MDEIFRFTVSEELEMALRLLIAALLGAIIGWERETADKPAGLRTLTLVCLGAAVFTIVSIFGFAEADEARVAAQIVTGIGFLGAGAILRAGEHIRGLTTAASIWAVAGVGMAVGAGMYILAVVAALITLAILRFLQRAKHLS